MKKKTSSKIYLHIVPLILFCLIGAFVAVKSGQDQNWDLQNYHYYDPYSYLTGNENRDFAVAGIQTYQNPKLDIISYELISHFKPIVASAFLGVIQSLNVWLIYELTLIIMSRFIKNKWLYIFAFVVGVVSFFSAINLGEVGETMADNLVSIPILLSLLLVFIVNHRNLTSKKLLMTIKLSAYFIMGVAVGLKLTSFPYAVALVLLELFNFKSIKQIALYLFYDLVALGAGILAIAGTWFYWLYKTFKNPVFPYYNHIFHSPYFQNINFVDPRWFPRNIMQVIFYPYYFFIHPHLVSEVHFVDLRTPLLFTGIIVVLFILLTSRLTRYLNFKFSKEIIELTLFIAISYILWEKQFSYSRYLVVLEFLAITYLVAIIWSLIKNVKLATILCVAMFTILFITTRPMDWGRIPWQKTFFGVVIPKDFISDRATVLLPGDQPLGYLVPFFPKGDTFISVGGALDTAADYKLINAKIKSLTKSRDAFYDIETAPTLSQETKTISSFGYYSTICKPINTYISTDFNSNPDYYELCKLS